MPGDFPGVHFIFHSLQAADLEEDWSALENDFRTFLAAEGV
jgi:hypothetical protein